MTRIITFAQAINEALDSALSQDDRVICYGLGVPDPKGLFGTTLGLQQRYGHERVFDMPTSENGMTGVAIGAAINGLIPVMSHQRLDFFLLAMDQLVNNAAKWHYMFGGRMSVPITIRLLIGRGWGQGPTHAQKLHAWFTHIPGLKVVMPFSPTDAKGLLMASIFDPNPVLFLEHRWLYNMTGEVPENSYRSSIGRCRVLRSGADVTLVGVSYMTLECLKAAEMLNSIGIKTDVIDARTLHPFDVETILHSVRKTGRIVVVDMGWMNAGFSADLVARVSEQCFSALKIPPCRIGFPECPTPTSSALSYHFYPRAVNIAQTVAKCMGRTLESNCNRDDAQLPHDVPDFTFKGPF